MIQLLHYVKSLVQVKGVNRIKSKQPEAIAVLWKYGQFSPQYNRNPIAYQWVCIWHRASFVKSKYNLHCNVSFDTTVNVLSFMCLQEGWIPCPFIGIYSILSPTGGIIHNTHTITRLPQRIRLYSIVSWQRLPAHTHQASLVPHIRSHLHNPSSRIHIFAELHVGSLWLVGTPWHTFVYPSLDK